VLKKPGVTRQIDHHRFRETYAHTVSALEYLNLGALGAFGCAGFLVVEAALAAFFAGGAAVSLLVSISARTFLFGGMAGKRFLGVKIVVSVGRAINSRREKGQLK
jgi:hypothetical protein